MITKTYLTKLIEKQKKAIRKELKNKNFEIALQLIYNCATILYETNQYYTDEILENALKEIAKNIGRRADFSASSDTVLFYDGFGLNDRGLIQIYLKALCKSKKIIYVTYDDRKNEIPDVLNILSSNKENATYFIKRDKFLLQVAQLSKIVEETKPKDFFFYSLPYDVVATTVMQKYESVLNRLQINLTDHAFWLCAKAIDKCIEFRDYGASVSYKYRNIPKEKIVKLLFYPELHKERDFQGFPFEVKENQKVIFSGGALYKTLGDNNKYYYLVSKILEQNCDVIFWYAGSGDDSQMQMLIEKFPERVFLTSERNDLYQVLKHTRLYLSTYPITGGLMYQYAACAGRVPVTLYFDECTQGFLLNQDNLNIEFTNIEDLCAEVSKLLNDDEYFTEREKEMLNAVITEEQFTSTLNTILKNDNEHNFEINYTDIETSSFRNEYLNRVTKKDIDAILTNKLTFNASMKHLPIHLIRGGGIKILKKIKMKLKRL